MSCQKCGREDGHWVGCAAAPRPVTMQDEVRSIAAAVVEPLMCERDGCSKAKRPAQGKGPKPKYCDDHSTPKSRKA